MNTGGGGFPIRSIRTESENMVRCSSRIIRHNRSLSPCQYHLVHFCLSLLLARIFFGLTSFLGSVMFLDG